ncbi:MAG: hypothetical protein ACP5I8_07725 [Phycisphaerae bacterium]
MPRAPAAAEKNTRNAAVDDARVPLRIIECLMKNHRHFVVWPRSDDQVIFSRTLVHMHAMRWRVAHRALGRWHIHWAWQFFRAVAKSAQNKPFAA